MSDIGWTPSWRRVALACAAAALVSGCSLWDGSTYDTVSVVPRRLEEVGALDLAAMRPDAPEAPEPAPPPPAPAELPLTVEECRALALAHNLDLQVQLIEPVMAEERLSQADAAFEPYLFSHFSYTKTRTPTSLRLDASEAETHHVNAGLRIPLRTGGEITVEQPFARIETDNEFAILNPAYTADLAFTVNQPLLRGGGVRRATHRMRLARYGGHMARARVG